MLADMVMACSVATLTQDDDNFGGFIEFMDGAGTDAGWELLEKLITGKTSAGELLRTCKLFQTSSSSSSVSSKS